jgi:hypothetical protein
VSSLLITVKRNKWLVEEVSYRGEPDYPADCLTDFRISDRRLSVWLIDDEERNKSRVLTALAANRQQVVNIDYLLFKQDILDKCEIEIEKTTGDTPDEHANTNWHHDLVKLSVKQTADFAYELCKANQTGRLLPFEVALALEQGLANKTLDESRLKPKLDEITKLALKAKRKDPTAT